MTCSIGVASLGVGLAEAETLIRRSDENLYRAKGAGRNRVIADEPDSSTQTGTANAGGTAAPRVVGEQE